LDRDKLFEDLKTWILQLPTVTQASHRFGGTEFHVDGLEFMHSHGPSFLDIRLSKTDQEAALKDGKAIPHRFAPQAGWISFRIEKAEDLGPAKELIQAAHENAKTTMEAYKTRPKSKLD
jgi:luciferase-like monooxygenase